MEQKKERKVTPVGEAKWAHLHTPKAPFKDDRGNDKGEPKFQIDVIFSQDDPLWKAWALEIQAQIKNIPDQVNKAGEKLNKQSPFKRELDENDQPTGRWYVTFKTGAKFKPGVFDVYGNPIPENVLIGNGSKVIVAYTPFEYLTFGGGVTFYLNAVQVIELVEYKSSTAATYGFTIKELEPTPEAPTESSVDVFGQSKNTGLLPF